MKTLNKKKVFSRLSENAKISLRNAGIISEHLKAKEVYPEHIFVGILLDKESLATKIIAGMKINIEDVLKKSFSSRSVDITTDIGNPREIIFSEDSKEILRNAYDISQKFSHVYVGSEHIMMALLESSDTYISDLSSLGLTPKSFFEKLKKTANYPLGILVKPRLHKGEDTEDSFIDEIGEDLVKKAEEGFLDPVIGRDDELREIINILSRRNKNNPVIVGEAGVGKTVLVEGLAQRIAEGRVPPSLRDFRIMSLNIASITAGSRMRGDVEEKLMTIIDEVLNANNIILFIDEIHTILSSSIPGTSSEIASILKPALLQDSFRCIGATTTTEYTRYFETDNALARRFQSLFLDEPSVEESEEILRNLKPILEAHHGIHISDDAIEVAVKLSDTYVSDRYLPDKAIDLLDEASASRRLDIEGEYEDLSSLYSKLLVLKNSKKFAIQDSNMKEAESLKRKEDRVNKKIQVLEKEYEKKKKSKINTVAVGDVRKVVSKWTGIPLSSLGDKERSSLLDLELDISKKIVGQGDAVKVVANAIKRARTGISDISRPWASFLFLGPTGVGKSELAKELTRILFGKEDRLIQIDMSEMMESHSVSKLIGSPPGYVGFQEGGWLTEKVKRNPHSVILFDEIEKAHPEVLNILLQIFEDGHLTDGKGSTVNFKNTIVILTSNIGAEEISRDRVLGFSEEKKSVKEKDVENAYSEMKNELMSELRNTLRPELLNRLDDIVIFRSLTEKDAKDIVKILVEELNGRLKEKNIRVVLDRKLINFIAKEGFSEEYGARPIRRVLQDKIENTVAQYILKEGWDIKDDNIVDLNMSFKEGEVVVEE